MSVKSSVSKPWKPSDLLPVSWAAPCAEGCNITHTVWSLFFHPWSSQPGRFATLMKATRTFSQLFKASFQKKKQKEKTFYVSGSRYNKAAVEAALTRDLCDITKGLLRVTVIAHKFCKQEQVKARERMDRFVCYSVFYHCPFWRVSLKTIQFHIISLRYSSNKVEKNTNSWVLDRLDWYFDFSEVKSQVNRGKERDLEKNRLHSAAIDVLRLLNADGGINDPDWMIRPSPSLE